MKASKTNFVQACLLAFFAFTFLSKITLATNDSLLKSIQVGYYMFNDNNPIDNVLHNQDDRKRDDFGLTFLLGYDVLVSFNLFKNATTTFQFTDHSGLYSKDLKTSTTLEANHPLYDDYAYLLLKHPDWNGLHVKNQVCYSKNVKEYKLINQYRYLTIGLAGSYTSIVSGPDQRMADRQRVFHKLMNSRNYYHQDFTDSSVFRGRNIYYFGFSPVLGVSNIGIRKPSFEVSGSLQGMVWFNTFSELGIPAISPIVNGSLLVGFGKKYPNKQRRFSFIYDLHYEPNEIVQRFSDPGSDGYHGAAFAFNFTSKRAYQKSAYLMYSFSPYAIYFPIGEEVDHTMNYVKKEGGNRVVEGFMNLDISLRFNR